MAPDQTGKSEPVENNRKRKCEASSTPAAKRAPTRKEDKENQSSSSPSSSVGSASSSRSSSDFSSTRRRKNRPVHLSKLEKTRQTCSHRHEMQNMYRTKPHLETELRRFRVLNVIQKKMIINGLAVCEERKMRSLEEALIPINKTFNAKHDLYDLCSLHFTKINSWGTSMDASNFATSAASVQSFSVLVDKNQHIKIIENGLSVLSLETKYLADKNTDFNKKYIKITSDEFRNAEAIYLAVIVKRMVAVEEKRGATRTAARAAAKTSVLMMPQVLEQKIRIGCMCLYEKGKKNNLNFGIDRIILVEAIDKPLYQVIFQELNESTTEWMKTLNYLQALHTENSKKEDQHLPRLMYTCFSENCDEMMEQMGERKEIRSRTEFKNLYSPSSSTSVCRSSQISASLLSAAAKALWLQSRYPCFERKNYQREEINEPLVDYFIAPMVTIIQNYCFYRYSKNRSKGNEIRKTKTITEVEEQQANRFAPLNIGADGKMKYGLNCTIPKGHLPHLCPVYSNRSNSLVPHFDKDGGKTYKQEGFVLNNPKLFTDLILNEKKLPRIAPEFRKPGDETAVMSVPATQDQVDAFNKRLRNAEIRKKVNTVERVIDVVRDVMMEEEDDVEKSGLDYEGNPIPTFGEMFFPSGKSEIYNILCRYYYSEIGHRPGYLTPEWLSRMMIGFIERYHDHIFTHKLQEVFEMQLRTMCMLSHIDWKKEHFNKPYQRMIELETEWLRQKEQQPGTSSSL